MALSLELNTFEEKLDRFQLAQPEERVAIVDVHHTRRLPYWLGGGICLCCKETKKGARYHNQRRLKCTDSGRQEGLWQESGMSDGCGMLDGCALVAWW